MPLNPRCGSTPDTIFDSIYNGFRKDGKPRARNRYAGRCRWCGHWCEPGQGVIGRSGTSGEWYISCTSETWKS